MSKPKCAVLIVETPPEFQPTHVHAVPTAILSAVFYARGISLKRAKELARAHNCHHLPCRGRFEGKWAMATVSLKCGQYPRKSASTIGGEA